MEPIRIKSNARKSTYSGKSSIASKDQSRIRQALKPELRSNHIPVKSSPTTWKSTGWSLKARVRKSTNDELLTPMVITKDKASIPDAAASNGDFNSRSENNEKKNPDQRSLWSLFSAPKVKENADDDACGFDTVSNGCHRDDNKLHGVQKIVSQDRRVTKREPSEEDIAKKTSPPSFNLLSKMKPLKHASRNLFAQLAKKPSDSSCQDLSGNIQQDPSNDATKQPHSRVGNRTADLPGNELSDNRIERPESRRNREQNTNIIRLTERPRTRDKIENYVTVKHSSVEESDSNGANNRRESVHSKDTELASVIQNQDKDCSLVQNDPCDTSSPTKYEEGSSEDLPMPTLTLPPEIEHRKATSNVSSERDENECLFIDEQAQPDSPQNERSSLVEDEEESHVLRVWSLQSDAETSSDFHNFDLSSSFSDSCSTGLDDSLLSTSTSLNSSALSFIEKGARSVEGFHDGKNSDYLSKSASEKNLEAARDTLRNENHSSRSKGFEEGPPKLQAQPNTHHLLQELDSLLECSTFHGESYSKVLMESTEDLNMEFETGCDMNLQIEGSEQSNVQLETTNNSNVHAVEKEPTNVQAEEKELPYLQIEESEQLNVQPEPSDDSNVQAQEREPSNFQAQEKEPSNVQAQEKEPSNVQAQEKEQSNMQNEESKNSNMPAEEKEPSNSRLEALEEEDRRDSLNQSKESDHENATESARNIFSLFSSAKRHMPPTNIVKLQFDRNPYSTSVHSDIPQDSPVLSVSCSGEKNQSIRTNLPEDVSASSVSNNKAADVVPESLTINVSLNSPVSTFSVEKSKDHSHLSNKQSPGPHLSVSCSGEKNQSIRTNLPEDVSASSVSNNKAADVVPESLMINVSLNSPVSTFSVEKSKDHSQFCLEVDPSSVGEIELSQPSVSLPTPEEHVVDDIPFLAFKSREDLVTYSKAVKLKVQKKSSQLNRVPAKKFVYPVVKNVKMKKRKKPSPLEAKIQALEKDLLWSMESKGLKEIVHPVLSRKGVALETVKKNDLVVNVRNEELERTHKRLKHKKRRRSKSESEHASNFRGIGSHSNSIKLSGSSHSQYYSSLHVKNIKGVKSETEHREKPSDKEKVVGLKHGHFPGLQKKISKVQSPERSHRETQIKRSKHRHQEWAICQKELPTTSEKPSLKLKLVTKAKAKSTSPSKIEQSPLALSTKPRESTVPLKSPTSHIPVNVQQLHLPSTSTATKDDVPGDKSPPTARPPEEESLPFKPFEKPVASKKSAFVSDALEDLLQGVDSTITPLISPSTISVKSAKVVFKVPCRQNHSVKTLDMALKRQKPMFVAAENYTKLTPKDSHHENKDKKKKKKKEKEKHKYKKHGFVFGTGPDDLVRKLPKLPFDNYGKSFARPLFEKKQQDSNIVSEKSKGFLEVRNVLSVSGKVAVKRQSENEMHSTKKIKQEPEESDESQNSANEIQQPILKMNPSFSGQDEPLPRESNTECKEQTREETQVQSGIKMVKKCEEYCQLGCICGSLNNSRTVQELSNHCRKVDCMFNCLCKKTSSTSVTGTRTRRPPTLSCDMLFYDDSYKFWRVGDSESHAVESKKLQLLDHLPELEKRTMMSTCARTRHFVPDKPDKWVKWKRKQLGVTSSVKNRSSELDNACQLALKSSNTGNKDTHQGTQICEVKQNQPRIVPLLLKSKSTQQKELADKANKILESKSKVSNLSATETTAKGSATFLQLSQQYLLNGKLMNLVALPNGNRMLIPATCVPLKVGEQNSPSSAPQSKLTYTQGGTSTTNVQLPKPRVKNSMQCTGKHVPNILSSSSAKGTIGHQKSVLPVQLQLTPTGLMLKPDMEAKTSSAAEPAADGNSNVSQASISEIHPGIFRISNPSDKSNFPGHKISGSVRITGSTVHVNAAQQAVPAKTCSVNAKDKLSTRAPLPNSSTKQDATFSANKQAPHHKNLAVCSPSESASNAKKEIFSTTSKPIGTMSEPSQMVISKTFFMLDKGMYIMMMTYPEFEWTDRIELEVKQGINKIFQSQAQNNRVLLSGDLELKLLLKEKQWARFHLIKCESVQHTGDVNGSTISLDKNTDGPNNADGSGSKAITSTDPVSKSSCETVLVTAKISVEDAQKVTDVTSSINEIIPSKSNLTPKVHESSSIRSTESELKKKCENVPVTTETKDKEGQKMKDATPNVCKLKTPKSNSTPETVESSPARSNDPDLKRPRDEILTTEKTNIKEVQKVNDVTSTVGKITLSKSNLKPETLGSSQARLTYPDLKKTHENVTTNTNAKEDQNEKDANSKVRGVMPVKNKITPGVHESNPTGELATSNTNEKLSAKPDSRVESSKKLSSSLPEFDKLSEIVRRTSVDGDDERMSPVKIINNAPDWLHDPKFQRPLEYQSYKGIKGPWFTTEKESVKVVLQRNKDKRSPWKSIPPRTLKRPSTSPLPDVSAKKSSKCNKTSFPNEQEDSGSSRSKGLTKDEEATSDVVHSVAVENIKELETSDCEDKNYLCETTGLLGGSSPVSSCTNIQDDLCKEASKTVDSILVNEKIVCDSPSEKQSEVIPSGGSESPRAASSLQDIRKSDGMDVEGEMKSENAEGTLDIEHFARFSEEDTYGPLDFDEKVSTSYELPAVDDDDNSSVASLRIDEGILEDTSNDDLVKSVPSPKNDVQESREESPKVIGDNLVKLPVTSSLDDLPHESDIKSVSSFSHMKDVVSTDITDSLQKEAHSTMARTDSDTVILPFTENAQEISVEGQSLPTQKLIPASPEVQVLDVSLGSQVSAPAVTEQLPKNQSPLTENVPMETTPIKSIDVHPKKSPILNIKFVATSNENCTSPLCSSPVCPSPQCMSPVSDDIPENSQNTSPIPVKDSDNTDAYLSGTEIDVVNTDDDDDEIDVETVLGVKPSLPNLNPYSSLREITSRLSSKLQEDQKTCPPPKKVKPPPPKKVKPHSPSKLSLQLSIGHRFGSPRHGKSKSLTYGPSIGNLQHSSSTNENRKKKKKSKRKTPLCPSEEWNVDLSRIFYKKREQAKEEEKTDELTDGKRIQKHNHLERMRRDELRKTFQQLHNAMHGSCTDDHKKPSKINILNEAIVEIKKVKNEEKALLQEKELVKKHQRRLVYVHSNLLHHARCRGQIIFPEGSKLAESMDRIRSGLSKHSTSTSSESKVQEGKVKTAKPPTVKYPKMDSSTDSSAINISVPKRKKSKKKKLHSDKKSSSSKKLTLKNSVPADETRGLKRKHKSVSYFPLEDLKKSSETKEQGKKDQGCSLGSVPSGSQQEIRNKYIYDVDYDDSEEESLPIECYVSSSDEAEREEDVNAMDYDDEEQYSDDGFIPASDEDTNDQEKEKGSSLEMRENLNAGSVIDLDDSSSSSGEDFGDRSETESHARLTGKKIPVPISAPKVKEVAPRKQASLVESEDSDSVDDDDLLIIAEENGITVEQTKGATAKEKVKGQESSELLKGCEIQGKSKTKEPSKMDKDAENFSSIPTNSQYAPVSKPGKTSNTRSIDCLKEGMGEKQHKAPLLNVIDEIMNRLKGGTSAISSAGEKSNETQRPTRVELDVPASASADIRRNQEKLSSKPLSSGVPSSTAPATDSIMSSAEVVKPIDVSSSHHHYQGSVSSDTKPSTSVGPASSSYQAKAQLSLKKLNEHLNLLDSDSSDDEEDQESTPVLTPTVSKSLQPKEEMDSSVIQKQKEVTQQRICDELIADEEVNDPKSTSNLTSYVSKNIQPAERKDESLSLKQKEFPQSRDLLCEESSSDEEVNNQGSTSAVTALTMNSSQEGKCTTSGKKEDIAQQTGVMLDDSSSSSSSSSEDDGDEDDEVGNQNHKTASRGISLKKGHHGKEDSSHDVDLVNVASTSYSKGSESVSSNQLQAEEKKSTMTSQKKTRSIQSTGALADLISSVKTRVNNEESIDATDSDSEDSDSEDDDVSDGASGDDEESSDDDEDEMKTEKEGGDNVAEEDSRSNGSENKKQNFIDLEKDVASISEEQGHQSNDESKKQDLTDLEKDVASISEEKGHQSKAENKKQDITDLEKDVMDISHEKSNQSEEPEGSSLDQNAPQSANDEENANHRVVTSAEEPAKDSSITEIGQRNQKQDESSTAEGSTSPLLDAKPVEEITDESFSIGDSVTDDDAACLSFAAMGNDEDHEALFDAGDRSSPLSLDMNVASDDEIDDIVCEPDEDTNRPGLLPSNTPSKDGTSTNETNSRIPETSSRAEPSTRGHPKPSSSFKDDLTLDEAISFLDIEKNSDGTLNVLLKGDYDDEKLDELFEKPGVMEYIITEASKKP